MNDAPEMRQIPGGTVTMTDRRRETSWSVDLGTYELAATVVTRERYAEATGEWPGSATVAGSPVEGVSWLDAVRFCNACSVRSGLRPAYRVGGERDGLPDVEWDETADGYRLPTEAEWEHAARAGTVAARYGPLDDIAWYRGNSGEHIHPVAGRKPNAWGLYDMLGNVWEWCWDAFDAVDHPGYRVLRGGGWFDEHWSCRASVRRRSHPDFRIDDVGFRIARSVTR
ncbi:Formylglycine-generating enzyme, required for sulfatase activity, contains SUMF1/FGE domain [Prauserella marina]|uniref:Formylglycine-generating enzyme, required for sulfatase activity, contains SUMF1/FGE domain n=2 Tax=Prauserella marina TaxID=530584 RepID=A0A1G6S8E5_9PSEU|nr:formylglycine-generating enzyme required for sulfatase activity [Prauserella marina]SDD12435.1 Formylglycine-generating enzyme, required for sulfatase activity, contains SUMF1/FGE domain [Prauserella marina]